MHSSESHSIFQSAIFGALQEAIPYRGKVLRIEITNEWGRATAQLIRNKIRGGRCWYWLPYGPLVEEKSGAGKTIGSSEARKNLITTITNEIILQAKKEGALFTRIELPQGWTHEDVVTMQSAAREKSLSIRASLERYTPEHSLVINLMQPLETLLGQMKQKGRYNIKIAEKHGVTVRSFDSLTDVPKKDFDELHGILCETAKRDGFGIHGRSYYEKFLTILGKEKAASLFLAYTKSDSGEAHVAAGLIATYWDKTATYYYGASGYEHRHTMAPYALQWAAIKDAKKRGMSYYDFLGIAPPNDEKHAWAGVTQFKEKLGGERIEYAPAFDIVAKPLSYLCYRLARKIRGIF